MNEEQPQNDQGDQPEELDLRRLYNQMDDSTDDKRLEVLRSLPMPGGQPPQPPQPPENPPLQSE